MGPLAIEFEARKLDAEILSRFRKLAPELQKEAGGHTEGARAGLEAQLIQIMVELLAKSPEFEIKQLAVKTNKGDISGKAKLTFAGGGQNLAGNILALLGSIDASAELSVSEPLFMLIAENALLSATAPQPEESAESNVDGLVKGLLTANIMVSENGSFKSAATYKHGVLTVNGRKLDLSNLP